jgi:hypothetical protein
MKKLLLSVGLLLSLVTASFSQDELVTRKIKINHADPYLVLLLISMDFSANTWLEPEISTRPFYNGGFTGGFGGGSYGGRNN